MPGAAITEYDPYSPEFQADPFAVYRWMLEEAPVFYSEKWNWWALSRWEDVRAAATDHDTFLSFEGIDIDATATDQSGPGFLPDIDNPRHDQLRKIVQPHFLPRRIAKHESHVREVIRGFVRGWKDRDEIDIAQELSWPAPMEIFFDLIGLPSAQEAGRADLERWVHELKDRDPGDDRLTPVAKAATEGIRNYFVDLLNERRRNPRQDLITHIVQAEIDGVPLADEDIVAASEVMGLMTILLFGSAETTSGLMSTFFKLVAENPDQRDDPAEEPGADRRRGGGGGPLRHPVAARRADHVPRGHRPRRDHPEGRAGRAGLRRREPRPPPVPEPRQVRRHPRRPAAPRLR